jgi:hypothetical protein
MISVFLGWFNWRGVRGIPAVGLLYVLLFSAIAWMLIQGIDYLHRKDKSQKGKQ